MAQSDIDGDYAFLEGSVRGLAGWLEDFAALMTMRLLRWQEANVAPGPLFEIGVYQAKYFSLLLRSARARNEDVFGLDTFQYAPEAQVRDGLAAAGFPFGYTLLKMFSTDVSASDLLQKFGAKPRFISVDGSHEKDDVHWDMRLSEQLLANDGIVSVDDFLNPLTLGVNDGVNTFFHQPRNLVPVFYTSNKLFLSRPGPAGRYRALIEDMLLADQREQASLNFQKMLGLDRSHVEQKLWGRQVLVA